MHLHFAYKIGTSCILCIKNVEHVGAGGDEVQDGVVRAADGGGARQEGGRDHIY